MLTLNSWAPSREAITIIFKVFGMTRPRDLPYHRRVLYHCAIQAGVSNGKTTTLDSINSLTILFPVEYIVSVRPLAVFTLKFGCSQYLRQGLGTKLWQFFGHFTTPPSIKYAYTWGFPVFTWKYVGKEISSKIKGFTGSCNSTVLFKILDSKVSGFNDR